MSTLISLYAAHETIKKWTQETWESLKETKTEIGDYLVVESMAVKGLHDEIKHWRFDKWTMSK